jgi:hypothetical protein
MQSQPNPTIPLPDSPSVIAPHQVWIHLSIQQQQQIRQALITIVQQSLMQLNINSTIGDSTDEQ